MSPENNKIEKFKELLLFIVKNFSDKTLTETKLWKLLYFCDADFFDKYGKTITGVDYFKNDFGATPDMKIIDKTLPLVDDFVRIEKKSRTDGKIMRIYKFIDPEKEIDYKVLTEIGRAHV